MKYILVDWPEIQDYMEHPDYPEKVFYDPNKGKWFIPEDWETKDWETEDWSGCEIGDLDDAMD